MKNLEANMLIAAVMLAGAWKLEQRLYTGHNRLSVVDLVQQVPLRNDSFCPKAPLY